MSCDPSMAANESPASPAACDCVFTLMWQRFTTLFGLKLAMTLIIAPIFVASYLGIQRLAGATREFEFTWIDHAAGFNVWWVYIYVSQYLIVPLPPLLAHTRDQLRRLVVGLSTTSILAFITFIVYPVAVKRPPRPDESNAIYDWLISVDTTGNAFPSLHVGLSTLAALYAHRVIDSAFSKQARFTLLAIIWVWTLLIAWSTMATKQHYIHDVIAGFVVAWIGHWVAWRRPPVAAE